MVSYYHILISGRVQGVGFRYFVLNNALNLGVNGFVRNLNNGDVEVFAELTDENQTEFLKIIRQGPPLSRIVDFDVEITSKFNFKGFKIR